MKDEETKMRFVELRAKGWSFDRIAQEDKTSKQTLLTWSKKLEPEIADLRAVELENLQEKFRVTWAQRIELLGEKLQAIKDELDKRDLSGLRTEKLFDLFMKYSNGLRAATMEKIFMKDKPDKAKGLEALFE